MADEQRKYDDFEELVFENRNKEYGAYDLRRSYKGLLTKAFFIGTSFFLTAIAVPVLLLNADVKGAKEMEGIEVDLMAKDVDTPDLEEEEPEPDPEEIYEQPKEPELQSLQDLAPPSDAPQVATVQNVVPEPTQNAKNETPPPTKEEMQDKAISTKTQEGVAATNNAPAPVKGVEGGQGTQAVKENVPIVPEKVDTKVIHETVDNEAEFPGGTQAFIRRIQENFDSEAVDGEGILKTEVRFVVEINGRVSDVKATGPNASFNREAERTIRSIRGWKPAEIKGQKVRSRFVVPVTMRFE